MNTETEKYRCLDGPFFGEIDSPFDAIHYNTKAEAFEARDEACFLYCEERWYNETTMSETDPWIPPGWDFETHGEITSGRQLTGPYAVKKITYKIEDV
jgi:hypothetical protein